MSKEYIRQLVRASRRMATAPTGSNIPSASSSSSSSTFSLRRPFLSCVENSRGENRSFSSAVAAVRYDDNHNHLGQYGHSFNNHQCDDDDDDDKKDNRNNKHCHTCTCKDKHPDVTIDKTQDAAIFVVEKTTATSRFPCGSDHHEDELDNLPDPLPEPKYSVHKRVLPQSLTAFSSPKGKKMLMESLFVDGTAESYWALTQHFINQGDPAFCGVTTLMMCLNALCIDPNIRWRGGWRYYGSEEVLLGRCCLSTERIKRLGITMEDFCQLGRCQGLRIDLKRPTPISNNVNVDDNDDGHGTCDSNGFSLEEFRDDALRILSDKVHRPILVVSFSRQALQQTGDGHFSTIAAYHKATDQLLVLDVARFKYAPYWVPMKDLYRSMQELDSVTKKPRGWFLLFPPKNHACQHATKEDRRPVEVVPIAGEKDICPVGDIRKQYCKSNPTPVRE
jgi:glutathione gamma-glutamylcysteinyltransferase